MGERIAFLIVGNAGAGQRTLVQLLEAWGGVCCQMDLATMRPAEKLSEWLDRQSPDALVVGATWALEPRSYNPDELARIASSVDEEVRVIHLQEAYEPTLRGLLAVPPPRDELPLQSEQQVLLSLYKHDVWIRRLKQDRPHFLELFTDHIPSRFEEILDFLGLVPDSSRVRNLLASHWPQREAPVEAPLEVEVRRKVALYEDRRLLLNYARFFTDSCRNQLTLDEEDSGHPFYFRDPIDPHKLQVLILVDVIMDLKHLRDYLADPLPGKPPTTMVMIFSHFQYVREILQDVSCLGHLESGRIKLWHVEDWRKCAEAEYQNHRSALIHSSKVLAPKGHALAAEVEQHFDDLYRQFVEVVKDAFSRAEDYYRSQTFFDRLQDIAQGAKPRVLIEQACFSLSAKQYSRIMASTLKSMGCEVFIHEPCRADRIDYVVANTIEVAEFQPDLTIRNPNGYAYAPYKHIPGAPTVIPLHDLEAHPGFVPLLRQQPLGKWDMVTYTEEAFRSDFEEAGAGGSQLFHEYPPAEEGLYTGETPRYEVGFVKTLHPALDLLGRIYSGQERHFVNLSDRNRITQVEASLMERLKEGSGLGFKECNRLSLENDWKHALVGFYQEQFCLHHLNALHRASFKLSLVGQNWDRLPHMRKYARGRVGEGLPYQRQFQDTAIHLSLNPWEEYHSRVFDGGRCGAFFLVYRVPDGVRWQGLPPWLKAGEHFDYFSSPEELVEKCRYYLEHPDERRRIGLKLKEALDLEATYEKACTRLLERFAHLISENLLLVRS